MKFNHLNVPTHWQHYWTRYPQGHTILEALIQWVSQVDGMVDNVNDWNTYLDGFVKQFDTELQSTVDTTLTDWQNSGFLADLINSTLLNTKADKVYVDNMLEGLATGRPQGAYPTLSALTTAHPTGDDAIYIVQADGYWYYWDETTSAWTKGALYQSPQLGKAPLKNVLLNPNMSSQTYWGPILATREVADNVTTFLASSKFGQVHNRTAPQTKGNKYFAGAYVKTESSLVYLDLYTSPNQLIKDYHSGSGQYELLGGVYTAIDDNAIDLRVVDERDSNWTNVSVTEGFVIPLTPTFGGGYEPTQEEIEHLIMKNNEGNIFFENEIFLDIIPAGNIFPKPLTLYDIDTAGSRLKVDVKSGVLTVTQPYTNLEDLEVVFAKRGVNNLPDFNVVRKINRNTGNRTALTVVSSDWVTAPYKVKAIANVDGTNPTSDFFTGGNHGYDNSGSTANNSATAYCSSLRYMVDGRETTSYTGDANYIDVYWTNHVQASNTTKEDGSGRNVLKEEHHAHFDGYEWTIENFIEPLEDITISTYYGLQCQKHNYTDALLYKGSFASKWQPSTTASTANDRNCEAIIHHKGTDWLDLFMTDEGIGSLQYSSKAHNAFGSTTKSYFYLIDETPFTQGDVLTLNGGYRFYSK